MNDDEAGAAGPAVADPTNPMTVPTTLVVAAVEAETAALAPEAVVPEVFRQLDNDQLARVVLLQLDENHFSLVEGFRYIGDAGEWTVLPKDLEKTDLASIPPFMSWFVSRYGTHTLAALLHDHLVHNGQRLDPKVPRSDADDVFRIALDELKVPYLRARIMWSAVTLATRWRSSWPVRATVIAWIATAVAGIATLVAGLTLANPSLVALAVSAPVPFSLLWSRRQYRAGLFGGYVLWLVALPAALNLAAYGAYNVAERALRRTRRIRPVNRQKAMPPPPSFKAM